MARTRLSTAIVRDHLRRIGSGEMPEGSLLPPESVICEEYSVGRSVVRDALQALHAKGFIVVRQGSVASVAPRYRWNVLDSDFLSVNSGSEFYSQLQAAREAIEPQVAALAAQNATDETIEQLDALNKLLAEQKKSPEQHSRIDIEFHETLAFASGNSILASFHSSLTSLGQRTRSASATIPGAIDRALVWHLQILDAVRERDPVAAAAAMQLHLRQVRGEIARLDEHELLAEPAPAGEPA